MKMSIFKQICIIMLLLLNQNCDLNQADALKTEVAQEGEVTWLLKNHP